MYNIKVEQTNQKKAALAIAQSLPNFFSKSGLMTLEKDLAEHELYGAFIDNDLLGFITLRKTDLAALEISWLAVLSNWQGQGIGSKLVKESLMAFATQGYKICYVKTLAETVVDPGYDKTRSFYKKLGFYTLEIISPYPGWTKDNPCQILAAALPLK